MFGSVAERKRSDCGESEMSHTWVCPRCLGSVSANDECVLGTQYVWHGKCRLLHEREQSADRVIRRAKRWRRFFRFISWLSKL